MKLILLKFYIIFLASDFFRWLWEVFTNLTPLEFGYIYIQLYLLTYCSFMLIVFYLWPFVVKIIYKVFLEEKEKPFSKQLDSIFKDWANEDISFEKCMMDSLDLFILKCRYRLCCTSLVYIAFNVTKGLILTIKIAFPTVVSKNFMGYKEILWIIIDNVSFFLNESGHLFLWVSLVCLADLIFFKLEFIWKVYLNY